MPQGPTECLGARGIPQRQNQRASVEGGGPGEQGRESASLDRTGMEGKCHLFSGKSGEALRKRWGVKKAPEMLLDFRGRKRMVGDHDNV